jgi:hypothetical protein
LGHAEYRRAGDRVIYGIVHVMLRTNLIYDVMSVTLRVVALRNFDWRTEIVPDSHDHEVRQRRLIQHGSAASQQRNRGHNNND